MLTRMEIISQAGRSLELPMFDVTSPYIVTDVSGLEPVKAELSSSPFATRDGSQFQSSRRVPRNIVLKVGIENGYGTKSVRDLRTNLYNVCMPQSRVTLRFFMDNALFATIVGIVETCDTSLFSRDPEVTISFMCFDPDFLAPSDTVVLGSAIPKAMDEHGYFQHIDYRGTTPTGLRLQMTTNAPLRSLALSARPSLAGSARALAFTAPDSSVASFPTGSELDIITVPGSKKAVAGGTGGGRSMLPMLVRGSIWFKINPGTNYILVKHDGPSILTYKLTYRTRHGGL